MAHLLLSRTNLMFLSFAGTTEPCYYSDITIEPNAYGEFVNGTSFTSGPVTICVDGTPYSLCNEGINDTASLLCARQGYYGPAYATPIFGYDTDFGPSTNSRAIYNISCLYDFFDTFSCNYVLPPNAGTGCDSYGGRAVITCLRTGIISGCITMCKF